MRIVVPRADWTNTVAWPSQVIFVSCDELIVPPLEMSSMLEMGDAAQSISVARGGREGSFESRLRISV
jgi:hypothetical protein